MSISDRDVEQLLANLVAIPSINPGFRQGQDPDEWYNEGRIGKFVTEWLCEAGLEVETYDVDADRPNVIARLAGRGALSILWEGHLDTVQVTGMQDPFVPRIEGGRLFGRGAVDDKACLTAFMLALRHLAEIRPDISVTFLAAMDEEHQYRGIKDYLTRGEHYDFGIAGEPTALRVVRSCKGCLRWHVDLFGKAAHTGSPEEGVSALEAARALISLYNEVVDANVIHPLLGNATLVCTEFTSGDGPNTVPSSARLRFDYRYLPSEDSAALWQRFSDITAAFAKAQNGIRAIVHPPFLDGAAMDVAEDEPVVEVLGRVCAAHGLQASPVGVAYGSDASKMTAAGIPTVIFGPGNIRQAHATVEYVEISAVTKAARMLVDFALAAASAAVSRKS